MAAFDSGSLGLGSAGRATPNEPPCFLGDFKWGLLLGAADQTAPVWEKSDCNLIVNVYKEILTPPVSEKSWKTDIYV